VMGSYKYIIFNDIHFIWPVHSYSGKKRSAMLLINIVSSFYSNNQGNKIMHVYADVMKVNLVYFTQGFCTGHTGVRYSLHNKYYELLFA